MTAITFRRNSADNRRQKRLRSLYFRSIQGVRKGVPMTTRGIAVNIAKLPEPLCKP